MNIDLIKTLKNCINPLCTYSLKVESTSHFFFHCHYYDSIRHIMFNEFCEVDVNLTNASDEKLVNILSYGSSLFSYSQNRSILNSSIRYIHFYFAIVSMSCLSKCNCCFNRKKTKNKKKTVYFRCILSVY